MVDDGSDASAPPRIARDDEDSIRRDRRLRGIGGGRDGEFADQPSLHPCLPPPRLTVPRRRPASSVAPTLPGDAPLYHAILTRRYLFRKVIPLLALLSVALCTAMVIIVFSVMGGFLQMVMDNGRKLIGDVKISGPMTGIAWYEEVLDELETLPTVEAATPVIETYGLIHMPYRRTATVQIVGIQPEGYDEVTGYHNTLYWQPLQGEVLDDAHPSDLRLATPFEGDDTETELQRTRIHEGMRSDVLEYLYDAGRSLTLPGTDQPGVVLGIRVSIANERVRNNVYQMPLNLFMPQHSVAVTVLALDEEGGVLDPESISLPVLNEFSVERFDIDSNVAFLPFELLQRRMRMDPGTRLTDEPMIDPDTGQIMTDDFGDPIMQTAFRPGRATAILVKAADGTAPEQLQQDVEAVYEAVFARHENEMPSPSIVQILTWEQQIARFIGAVKKETALVISLFGIISLVSVFLVLAIFWTIVQQKTRDIGILRAVGAARSGVAWLFLRYGLVLGLIGSILGGILAYIIVNNINPIHEFVGRAFGVYVWDPEVYYFDELPSDVNDGAAVIVMAAGVGFAVLGALIPALIAAFVNPVRALRYE
ncbi:MAG: ABC transporter permease [Planctomycetota bacterium]